MEVITTIHKKGEGRAQSSGLTLADVFVVRNRKTEWRAQLLVEKFCNNSTLAVNFQNQSTPTKVSHFNKEVLTRLCVCHPQETACKRILYRLSYWRLIDCLSVWNKDESKSVSSARENGKSFSNEHNLIITLPLRIRHYITTTCLASTYYKHLQAFLEEKVPFLLKAGARR